MTAPITYESFIILYVWIGLMALLPFLVAFIVLLAESIKHKWVSRFKIPFIIVSAVLGTSIIGLVIFLLTLLPH